MRSLILGTFILMFGASVALAEKLEQPDSEYYSKLEQQCEKGGSVECCLASVRSMQQGGYMLTENGMCPQGYQRNMLRCISSYQWCIPAKTKESE